jgi:CRP-like cAMP-binding protein
VDGGLANATTYITGRLPMTDLGQRLRRHPFVATMSDDDVNTLEGCGLSYLSFEPGDKLVREGKVADACFLIDRGDVGLDMYVDRAESRTLQVIHAGEIVGWSWLLPPYLGTYDATALTPVTAMRIDAPILREAMESDRAFGYAILVRVCQVAVSRLEATRREILEVYQRESPSREARTMPPGDMRRVG